MEIILLKNIEKVGVKFDIVNVKAGYGRNYLIPQKLAIVANERNRNNLESFKRQEAAKLGKRLDEFKAVADKLKGQVLKMEVKAGTSGKIFGSVTNIQLARALKEQLEIEVDRHNILLPESIKMLGAYTASLDLHPEVDAKFDFVVVGEDGQTAESIAAAAKANEPVKAPTEAAEVTAEEETETPGGE
jgi:large subunit ribosomal protein L9